jgi:hypothetical protein
MSAPQPIPADGTTETPNASGEEGYGRNYELLMQALEVAVRKGANKWT